MSIWKEAFADNPLIAILRGVTPQRALTVSGVLVDNGFRIIEVPLNSPDPFASIENIAARFGDRIVVGAGTVTKPDQVDSVGDAGGQIIVAPNFNKAVGERATGRNMIWCPGVLSPTEAFDALAQGASLLKFFPAEMIPAKAIKALRAVLPKDARIAVVGGIDPNAMAEYHAAGANGFGLGSALFRPDMEVSELSARATEFMQMYRALQVRKSND